MITRTLLFVSLALISCGLAFGQSDNTIYINNDSPQVIAVGGGSFLGVFTEDNDKGVVVTRVIKDSPADKAGLKKDDIIVGFDNDQVTSVRKLNRLISEAAPGQKVNLSVTRDGSKQTLSVTMGKRQDYPQVFTYNGNGFEVFNQAQEARDRVQAFRDQLQQNGQWYSTDGNQFFFGPGVSRRIGVTTTELSEQLAEYFGVKDKHGLLIQTVSENSPASKAGLKAGDVITEVDGDKIETTGDLTRAINRKEDGEIKVTLVRNKSSMTVNLTPEKRSETRSGTYYFGSPETEINLPSIAIPWIPPINIDLPRIVIPSIDIPTVDIPAIRINPMAYRYMTTPAVRAQIRSAVRSSIAPMRYRTVRLPRLGTLL
ncbi:MAG TPA: PDZ domain-containing protein [Blastocatellia bacterium]|nr:PDZ domain-containing protein [Blastocatellia bacterium]